MPQSSSTVSRNKILRNWDVEKDTLTEKVGKTQAWTRVTKRAFPYEHGRPLPKTTAKKALDYIASLMKPYPFQLRYSMARPLWFRFTEAWCDTGDEQKALLAI